MMVQEEFDPSTRYFPKCFIETNFGHYEMSDCIWVQDNPEIPFRGTLTGLVVKGGVTNRIGHTTRFDNHSGTTRTFKVDIENLKEIPGVPPRFNLCFGKP